MIVQQARTIAPQGVPATNTNGEFLRPASTFRNWITADGRPGPTGRGGFKAEAGRYHLLWLAGLPVGLAHFDVRS